MKYEYGVSLSQLRTSLKYRSKEYLLENSLHGIRYIVNSSLRKWERITWFVLTVSSLSAAVWIMLTIWNKFQREPILNEVNLFTSRDSKFDFPQIFLCFDWSQLNHSSLKEDERTLYEKVYNWQWDRAIEPLQDELQNARNFRSIFYSLTPDCGVFYGSCTFIGKEEACSRMLVKVITSVGACCKFASRPFTLMDSSLSFSFMPAIYPFKLYMMNKMDDGPQRDQKPLDVIHEPKTVKIEAFVTYTTSGFQMLWQPRRCNYGSTLTVNNCELRCVSSRVFAKCGCAPWFLTEFGDYRECSLSEYSCMNASHTETMDCDCLLPCDHIAYNCYKIIHNSDTSMKNEIFKITLKNRPFLLRKQIRFGYLDLLVSFGGIAGLFLGYSILTTIEFCYYLSLKVYCSAVVEATRKKHNIIKVRVVEHKVPSKLDYNYVD